MNEVVSVIKAVGNATGNDKLALLKRYEKVEGLKEILHFIYNPYCKTGISDAKLSSGLASIKAPKDNYFKEPAYREVIRYFKTHQTGSTADAVYAARFARFCEVHYGYDAMRLACAIVTQNLKIGVTATSLNKVYGNDFIPKTGCMLGTLYGDVNPASVAWPCIITEKLDGVRRVLVKENGVCRMYSRSGHEDTGLVEIINEAQYLPDNYVYDGELLAAGTFKDSIAQRQATNSIANSKGNRTGLTFNVFDMVPVDDFYAGKCDRPAIERKILLAATFNDESLQYIDDMWFSRIQAFGIEALLSVIKPVQILGLAHNIDSVTPIAEEIWRRGGEGVMLNTTIGKYEIKRSKQLLKIKHTEEVVLPVVDILEGTGKYEDSMGAIVVQYKNSYVGVGSGFTDDQRYDIWNNPDKYIGRKVEIETFGESTNAQGYVSLNCPIFKRFVGVTE